MGGAPFPFNYDHETSKLYYSFAISAYCTEHNLQMMDCPGVCEHLTASGMVDTSSGKANAVVISDEAAETQLSLLELTEHTVWAPRAMSPWDLSYALITTGAFPRQVHQYCAGCYVHSAWFAAWEAIRDETFSKMRTDGLGKTPILTGYSAGGVLVQFIAVELAKDEGLRARYIFTYGSPRAGNLLFVSFLSKLVGFEHGVSEAWRIVNFKDPAPHLTPLYLGYVHPFTEVMTYTDEASDYRVCGLTPLFEDPSCSLMSLSITRESHENYFERDSFAMTANCGLANQANSYFNDTKGFVFGAQVQGVFSWITGN